MHLAVKGTAAGPVHVQISDTGVGFPVNIDLDRIDSLGLRLVSDLTRQLTGVLEVAKL